MLTINVTAEQAEDALVLLAGHLPAGVPIGRPVLATGGAEDGGVEVLTEVAEDEPMVWWVWPGHAARLVPLDRGRNELVEWAHQIERSRTLSRTE